jgi:hypothetical protein
MNLFAIGFGLVGTGLGIWNRVDKIRDDRAKERAELPRMTAEMSPGEGEWRWITIRFLPLGREPFWIESIRPLDDGDVFAMSSYRSFDSEFVVGLRTVPNPSTATSVVRVEKTCGPDAAGTIVLDLWIRSPRSNPRIQATCVRMSSTRSDATFKRQTVSISAIAQMKSAEA